MPRAVSSKHKQGHPPHPIPYQGSKRVLAGSILQYFPQHVARMVEPFAGSAAMSLASAFQQRADHFWINDAHQPLADLWREILSHPRRLADRYAALWGKQLGNERSFYNDVRRQFNTTHQVEHFLFLLARCTKACVRYNASGQFNNSPDHRRKGAKPANMRARIEGAAALLADRTTITSDDYLSVLQHCQPNDLIYMDPPYQGVSTARDSRYAPSIEHDAFCESLAALNQKESLYLVSYDGRTGKKSFGESLPDDLNLQRIELKAGRSSQATLLGRAEVTYESLYLSPTLSALLNRASSPKSAVGVTTGKR